LPVRTFPPGPLSFVLSAEFAMGRQPLLPVKTEI
jgi:hypothetical protein